MERILFVLAGVYGFSAVALGAFGAHGMRKIFDTATDGVKRAEWWQTAAHYHLVHAMAIALAAYLASRVSGAVPIVAGACFAAGVVVFSGSLYAMAATGARSLGMITPVGGLLLLAGWLAVVMAAWRLG